MSETGTFSETVKTVYGKVRTVCDRIGKVIGLVGMWIFRLRKIREALKPNEAFPTKQNALCDIL